MIDFSYLQNMEITADSTAVMRCPWLPGDDPHLVLKYAGESNKPYYNAQLRRVRNNGRTARAGIISPELIGDMRDEDRELFPKFVIQGWGGIVDTAGKKVKYSPEAAVAFCASLPRDLFDEVRMFAGDIYNFRDLAPIEVDNTAGN